MTLSSITRREFIATAGLGIAAMVVPAIGSAGETGPAKTPRAGGRSPGSRPSLPYRPYTLSPYDRGLVIEDVWPTIFFGDEVIPEIKRKAAKLPWARQALELMAKEAAMVMPKPPQLPVERAGWRHDFYSRVTAEHLLYDPDSQTRFLDPSTGVYEFDEAQRQAWVLLTHERTYRMMRSLGVLYRVTGDERYARWVAQGMRKAVEYFKHEEFVTGSSIRALYHQPLYDAAVLMILANIYSLTKQSDAYSDRDADDIRAGIFEKRMGDMQAFLAAHPTGNMSCYVSGALAHCGRVFERDDWTKLGIGESSGVRTLLTKGLCVDKDGRTDGMWREGTMFYHFYSMCPLVTLWEQAKQSANGATRDADLRTRFAEMFAAPVALVDRELRLPVIGDLGAPRVMNLAAYRHLYEYAAGRLDPARFGPMLAEIYARSGAKRVELSALAYGPDALPKPGGIGRGSTLLPAASIGVFRSSSAEKLQVLFRAGRYGGGHDHPDRLGIALGAFGQPISPDLGTAGYSIHPIVHNYYRATIAHNTLFADEKDQPGEAVLDWRGNDKNPRARGVISGEDGVRYQRTVFFAGPYVVLLDEYSSEAEHRFGWTYHAYGKLNVVSPKLEPGSKAMLGMPALPADGAYAMLTDRLSGVASEQIEAEWDVAGGVRMRLLAVSDGPIEVTAARSPGQPIPDKLGCVLLRAPGKSRRIAAVLEPCRGTGSVVSVRLRGDAVVVRLKSGGERVYDWKP